MKAPSPFCLFLTALFWFFGFTSQGNLARGFWNALTPDDTSVEEAIESQRKVKPGCKVCDDTRCVPCPNCDGIGDYTAMGNRSVKCTSCSGRGFVICRACFSKYDEDPNDIESIREIMRRMPDWILWQSFVCVDTRKTGRSALFVLLDNSTCS